MKCISIRQPWAGLIGSGRKTIELRTWSTSYRGPLLVLAGGAFAAGDVGWPKVGPRGVALCIVDLVDVRPATREDAERACSKRPEHDDNGKPHFAWMLSNPRPVKHVPVKGRLGLYDADPTLLEAIGAP